MKLNKVEITLGGRYCLEIAIREAVATEVYYTQRGWEMEYSRLKHNKLLDTYKFKMVFVKEEK